MTNLAAGDTSVGSTPITLRQSDLLGIALDRSHRDVT